MRWPAAASKLNVTLQREASLKVVVDRALRASRVLSNPSPMRLVYPCLSDASSYRSAMVYHVHCILGDAVCLRAGGDTLRYAMDLEMDIT